MAFGIDDALGLASLAFSGLTKNKKPQTVNYEKTPAPNLKMMDSTMIGDLKEQAFTTASAIADKQTKNILSTANSANGLRSGKVFKTAFDTNTALAGNLADTMTNIDTTALNMNNSMLQWTANFNAAQNATAANVALGNASTINQANANNTAGTDAAFGALANLAFRTDKDGNRINMFSDIFGEKTTSEVNSNSNTKYLQNNVKLTGKTGFDNKFSGLFAN